MSRFRPADIAETKGSSGSYLGYIPVTINNFEDVTDNYDWADVFWNIELVSENSPYPYTMSILGSYEREPNGNIATNSLLKRLYNFFDVIGFEGGPDISGQMVDEKGDIIESFERFYHDNFLKKHQQLYAYAYRERGKDGKVYTRVYPKLSNNQKDLEGYINFCKSKGIIKEVEENDTVASTPANGAQHSSTPF
jgi:hypothetical protein